MKGDNIMSKCVTYHAFRDYFTVCKPDAEKAPETKPEKADTPKEESAYVPPANADALKYGFSKYQ